MATFKFAVSGQYLDLLTPTRGISDGLNVNSFTFDFRSPEWVGCADKWLHLYNPDYNGDDSTYDLVIIEDEIPADRGVNLPSGIWEVFVHGNVVLNGEVIQRYVTETQSIQIVPSGIFDNAPIGEVAPSVAEQLSAMVRDAYNDRITTATATVDNEFGTPAVMVSTSGEEGHKSINFDFHNLKGNGISSVVFIQSGDNAGRITVTLTDGTTASFDGIADALAYLYDHTTEVVVAEIQAYLEEHAGDLVPDDSITYDKLAGDLTDTNTVPQMDGTADKGNDPAYARADHVHPSDTSKVDVEVGKGLSANDFTDTLKNKLDGIAPGAEVNQNTFGNAKVGNTTITAGAKTDTLEFIAGDSIQITPDSTNKTITITSTASGNVTGVKGDAEEDYRTGNVNITKGNIGLGNVDNTSDMNKPVSTATQLALDGKTSAMLVEVTDTQPTDPDNKLWIPMTNYSSYSVPVMDDMVAGNIEYSSSETYSSGTVGKELQNLNGAITSKLPNLESTGDNTDRLAEINAALAQGGCVLGEGTFFISDTIVMPNNASLIGCGVNTVISLVSSATNKSAIKMAQFNTIENLKLYGAKAATSTIGNVHGIEWSGDYSTSTNPYTQPRLGKISNVYIDSFSGGGIYCNNTGYETYTSLVANNVTIYSCCVGIYIPYWSEYHQFTAIKTWNCFYGCINNGGNNSFVNCDFSGSKEIGFKIENPNDANPNNTHGMCVGCLFNHIKNNTGNAVVISDTHNGFSFVGCQLFYGNISISNSTGIVFDGCTCGAISITVTGTGVNIFSNNTFHAQPTVNATSATVFDNCYERTNNKAISPFQKTGTLTPVSGTSAYEVMVKQIGNIVTIRGFIQTVAITANTLTTIASLSGIDIPTAGIRTFACYAAYAYDPQNICYCQVSPTQGLRVNIPTTGNYAITFNIVYMLEDSQIT